MQRIAAARGWREGLIATGAAVVLFTTYCQALSWVDSMAASSLASLEWGMIAGTPAGVLGWLVWRRRTQLAHFAGRGTAPAVLSVAVLFVIVLVGGSTTHLIASAPPWSDAVGRLTNNMLDLIPFAAALSAVPAALIAADVVRRPARCRDADAPFAGEAPRWITLPEQPGLRLRVSDVRLVRAAGNYCEFHASDRVHCVRVPIKAMAGRLRAAGFVRVHRSVLVNSGRLKAVEPLGRGRFSVRLDCGTVVPIGRAFQQQVNEVLADQARSSTDQPIVG